MYLKKDTQDLQTSVLGRSIEVFEIREVIKLNTEREKFRE